MRSVTIQIKKADVLNNVARQAGYAGMKQQVADPTAYDRQMISAADEDQLTRWWTEACSQATTSLSAWADVVNVDAAGDYTVMLGMTDNWNFALQGPMQISLQHFIEHFILAQWAVLTANQAQAESCTALSQQDLADVHIKLYARVRPAAPIRDYDTTIEG